MDLALKLLSEAVLVLRFGQVECEAKRRFSWLSVSSLTKATVCNGGWNILVEGTQKGVR
jgi:hypothetical protein